MQACEPGRGQGEYPAERMLLTFEEVISGGQGASVVGGKALHLAEMAAVKDSAAAFAVPTGAVLTTAAYTAHFAASGLDADAMLDGSLPLSEVRAALCATAPSAELVDAVERFVGSAPATTAWAVRSSGTVEDGAAKSFAGQFETVWMHACMHCPTIPSLHPIRVMNLESQTPCYPERCSRANNSGLWTISQGHVPCAMGHICNRC